MSNYEEKRMQRMKRILNQNKIRRKECENKTFKLVGVVNPLKIFPDFVLPVFVCKQDGRTYVQEGDDNTQTLNSFYETEPYKDLQDVVYLDDVNTNEFSHSLFTIHSKPVFAFQISEKSYFVGHAEDLKAFLKDYTTENEILKEEIEDFIKCGWKSLIMSRDEIALQSHLLIIL